MKNATLTSIAILLSMSSLADAMDVYPGCAVPTVNPAHKTFFVDPNRGSMTGDGSLAKPWHTLAEVLNPAYKLIATKQHGNKFVCCGDTTLYDVNPTGPIKPGDTILLMSGDHGAPTITNLFNPSFITVAAAPGQTPVVRATIIMSATKWIFQGLKFQDVFPAGGDRNKLNGLIRTGWGEWQGQSSDIVFDNDSFSAADDVSKWSSNDWLNIPYFDAIYSRTPCIAVTNSHFYNISNAIQMQADNGLFKKNLIEDFAVDAFDMVGSNLTVQNNTVRNNTSDGTITAVFHPDGVQGWTAGGLTNKNFVVDSNIITKQADTKGGWMQGISIFDGKWDGVKITNNVVVNDAWHGIALYGVANATVVNNTVVGSSATPTWITFQKGKDGTVPANPVVRNNIAPQLIVNGTNATVDHNIASLEFSIPPAGSSVAGGWVKTGTTGTKNTVNAAIMSQFFTLNNQTGAYDLRIKPNSPAVAFGTNVGAPVVDLLGRTRSVPDDIGAYNH